MKYYSQFKGNTLGLFPSLFDDLDPANRWVKLARRLPWRYIELEYNARLRNRHRGADNKPARMVVAACIIKRKLRLTAGETVALIQENPYMQYFCGLSDFTSRRIFSPAAHQSARAHQRGRDTPARRARQAPGTRPILLPSAQSRSG